MSFSINTKEQKILLAEARESIISKLEGRRPNFIPDYNSTVLYQPYGAFVSLHKKNEKGEKNLRGCIGRMSANLPLLETVRTMAREAAFGDPRFPQIKPGEMEQCNIEISVLSPMTICPDPQKVEVGVHGLYLVKSGHSGVLLPQVPVEQKWNKDEYLNYICVKAGLPAGSYSEPGAVLYTFTAFVFGEEKADK